MSRYTNNGSASCLPLVGLALNDVLPSAVRINGAVSPMTRATPRITAVSTPLRAVGSTTRRKVR